MIDSKENSYGQILKSTTLVGGSQVINILIGIVRTKFMAVLLGPAGVGLMGMYQALIDLLSTVTGLGIRSSGVRQISEAVGSGDDVRVARTIKTLRSAALVLGIFGTLVTVILSRPLSRLSFGNYDHAWAIAVLGVTLFLGSVSGGQAALVQGMRRIADFAYISVTGAILGTALSVPILFFLGESGIVPSLLVVSAMTMLPSWWYARRIKVLQVIMSVTDLIRESRGLLSLGLVFMASGVMTAGAFYLIRALVSRELGLESLGLYQSAMNLSTIYIGIVLNAMSIDFYPRLTAVAQDNVTVNRLVNEQTEVGMLLATPGLLLTITFAPYVIHALYSSKFIPAYEVLRWQILGIFLRVVAWPMGFVLLAKGKGRTFFWTELVWNSLHVGLVWAGLQLFGLPGTGMAFFSLYVSYTVGIFLVVNRVSGFRWTASNIRNGVLLMATVGLVFILPYLLKRLFAIAIITVLTALVSWYCIKRIFDLAGSAYLAQVLYKLKKRTKLLKS